jgi:site-specific DNA-methyltransferase (adenine-specific)
MNLIQGDCLEKMKDISDNSVDLLFCDLPYGQTSCKWDCLIELELFWKQVNRICKAECPMFFTCSTKFGVSLINSNPKNFRYDLVWVKSAPCGFLNAKKMPMKKHEMIYVFYRKLPFYDLSSHSHKFLKEQVIKTEELCKYDVNKNAYGGGKEGRIKISKKKQDHETKYDPPLPNSVIKENTNRNSELYGKLEDNGYTSEERKTNVYDPPLPNSILEIKSEKGKHATQKPTDLIEWCLKYYSKEGDTILDPTMGSGSTGVACKNMNRNFIGIEKDEEIFKIASERIENI